MMIIRSPAWARERCRISPARFLAECCKRQLNHGSFVLLYFRLFTFSDLYWVCLSVFSCTVLFVSIRQVIGCENRLRNDLYCVEWGVKLYSNQPTIIRSEFLLDPHTAHQIRATRLALNDCRTCSVAIYLGHLDQCKPMTGALAGRQSDTSAFSRKRSDRARGRPPQTGSINLSNETKFAVFERQNTPYRSASIQKEVATVGWQPETASLMPIVGNESGWPKIIINDTITFFLKLQSAFW